MNLPEFGLELIPLPSTVVSSLYRRLHCITLHYIGMFNILASRYLMVQSTSLGSFVASWHVQNGIWTQLDRPKTDRTTSM